MCVCMYVLVTVVYSHWYVCIGYSGLQPLVCMCWLQWFTATGMYVLVTVVYSHWYVCIGYSGLQPLVCMYWLQWFTATGKMDCIAKLGAGNGIILM